MYEKEANENHGATTGGGNLNEDEYATRQTSEATHVQKQESPTKSLSKTKSKDSVKEEQKHEENKEECKEPSNPIGTLTVII